MENACKEANAYDFIMKLPKVNCCFIKHNFLNILNYALQIKSLKTHKAGNICCLGQPGVKGCPEVPGFELRPSDSQPDAMTPFLITFLKL